MSLHKNYVVRIVSIEAIAMSRSVYAVICSMICAIPSLSPWSYHFLHGICVAACPSHTCISVVSFCNIISISLSYLGLIIYGNAIWAIRRVDNACCIQQDTHFCPLSRILLQQSLMESKVHGNRYVILHVYFRLTLRSISICPLVFWQR